MCARLTVPPPNHVAHSMPFDVDGPAAESSRDARRRFYRITPEGRRALDAEVERLERIVKTARTIRKAAKA